MYRNVNAPPVLGANIAPQPQLAHCYTAPAVAYGGYGCNNFAIIVVLFILLIIIGACCFKC